MEYYLAVIFKSTREKCVIPYEQCLNLDNPKKSEHAKIYKFKRRSSANQEYEQDGYILNYFSEWLKYHK